MTLTYQQSIERIAKILVDFDKEPSLDNEMIIFASAIYGVNKQQIVDDVKEMIR